MADSREEAIVQILMLAEEHKILALVIDDYNPHLSVNCFNPYNSKIDVVGRIIGEPIPGSDRLRQRVLHLDIHLHDGDVVRRISRLMN